MSLNIGKCFEIQLKKSIPEYALFYRLPDAAQSFGTNNNLRFSNKNPFDFLLWDSKRKILYAFEVKTVSGKSISFEKTKGEKGIIHYHQIKGLNDWNKYEGIKSGFIIEFRKIETTIFLDIENFNLLISKINKKSFNFDDIVNSTLPYYIIPQKKARTKYTYDIDYLLTNIKQDMEVS